MQIFVPKDTGAETRVALTPEAAAKLVKLGFGVTIAPGLGAHLGFTDEDYARQSVALAGAGANEADIILRLHPPGAPDIQGLRPGTVLLGFLEPFFKPQLVQALAEAGVTALCMELIPRTTLAQRMDALSSQANLAGYAAVTLAAERLDKALPMMSTPAGTIAPARVFVLGAGVAGLQAIATARRLGARVEAFDTRPAAQEQIASLGARALTIDLGETGEAKGGYAQALSEAQLEKQREALARSCAAADIVITTAQVFGRPAPRLVTLEMVRGMRAGSVIIDLAASTGGNVEGAKENQEVEVGGVIILGDSNLARRVPKDASQMYANNVASLLEHLWDREAKRLKLGGEDEIASSVLLTHDGQIRHEGIRALAARS